MSSPLSHGELHKLPIDWLNFLIANQKLLCGCFCLAEMVGGKRGQYKALLSANENIHSNYQITKDIDHTLIRLLDNSNHKNCSEHVFKNAHASFYLISQNFCSFFGAELEINQPW